MDRVCNAVRVMLWDRGHDDVTVLPYTKIPGSKMVCGDRWRCVVIPQKRVGVKIARLAHIDGINEIVAHSVTAMAARSMSSSGIHLVPASILENDVVNHPLVPKHINEGPGGDLQYPTILLTDPVCVYYNFSVGDVIATIRPGSNGDFTYRRRVVPTRVRDE